MVDVIPAGDVCLDEGVEPSRAPGCCEVAAPIGRGSSRRSAARTAVRRRTHVDIVIWGVTASTTDQRMGRRRVRTGELTSSSRVVLVEGGDLVGVDRSDVGHVTE